MAAAAASTMCSGVAKHGSPICNRAMSPPGGISMPAILSRLNPRRAALLGAAIRRPGLGPGHLQQVGDHHVLARQAQHERIGALLDALDLVLVGFERLRERKETQVDHPRLEAELM